MIEFMLSNTYLRLWFSIGQFGAALLTRSNPLSLPLPNTTKHTTAAPSLSVNPVPRGRLIALRTHDRRLTNFQTCSIFPVLFCLCSILLRNKSMLPGPKNCVVVKLPNMRNFPCIICLCSILLCNKSRLPGPNTQFKSRNQVEVRKNTIQTRYDAKICD